jgi:DNA-binding transcriptional regulator GbsR (MarR family)
MNLEEAKIKFVQSWGVLGSSWGINKAMAQIHALLLISPEALSAEEVMDELQISRGNANMNLRALIDWGIIHKELRIGERKEFFKAEKDIIELARIITAERRKREIEPMLKALKDIQDLDSPKSDEHKEFKKVTGDLLSFTKKANGLMEKFTNGDKNWFYKLILRI